MTDADPVITDTQNKLPLLVLMPHASGHVPIEVLSQMLGERLFDAEIRAAHHTHLFYEGDPYTDLIFKLDTSYMLPATASRFVVDLNRYRGDEDDNGVIKRVDFHHKPLYPDGFTLSPCEKEERLKRYYDSYHHEVQRLISTHGIKLLIDGHSMTPYGPSLGPDEGESRPAYTLLTGGDAQGEPRPGLTASLTPEKARAVKQLVEQHFLPLLDELAGKERRPPLQPIVALNSPWDSDEIANTHVDAVAGFGFEINRGLYLDEEKPLWDNVARLNQAFVTFAPQALELFTKTP